LYVAKKVKLTINVDRTTDCTRPDAVALNRVGIVA